MSKEELDAFAVPIVDGVTELGGKIQVVGGSGVAVRNGDEMVIREETVDVEGGVDKVAGVAVTEITRVELMPGLSGSLRVGFVTTLEDLANFIVVVPRRDFMWCCCFGFIVNKSVGILGN